MIEMFAKPTAAARASVTARRRGWAFRTSSASLGWSATGPHPPQASRHVHPVCLCRRDFARPAGAVDVLKQCGIRHIEFRSILKTNVLALTDHQIDGFKLLLDRNGFKLSAIGSPLGKVRADEPFGHTWTSSNGPSSWQEVWDPEHPHLLVLPGRGCDRCRLAQAPRRGVEADGRNGRAGGDATVRLLHENEHRIYGDSPERVADLLEQIQSPALGAVYDPANYVFCGYDPVLGWEKSKHRTVHFHIKDWVRGESTAASPARATAAFRTSCQTRCNEGMTALRRWNRTCSAASDRRRHRHGTVPEGRRGSANHLPPSWRTRENGVTPVRHRGDVAWPPSRCRPARRAGLITGHLSTSAPARSTSWPGAPASTATLSRSALG